MRPMPTIVVPFLLSLLAGPGTARGADEVTIYRCTDAKGRLTLRDSPCAKGEQQQTRTMLRPKDAPPRPRAPVSEPRMRQDVPSAPQVVLAYPPRPLYECVTPDGDRYTSESPEGRPRWVPLWTLGYPVVPVAPRRESGVDFRIGNRHAEISGGSHVIDGGVYDMGPGMVTDRPLYPIAAGPGSWIRDACQALPQAEVCDRVRDQRDAVRRRFFNAQPSERDVLRVEERGLNARLDSDCGGR